MFRKLQKKSKKYSDRVSNPGPFACEANVTIALLETAYLRCDCSKNLLPLHHRSVILLADFSKQYYISKQNFELIAFGRRIG